MQHYHTRLDMKMQFQCTNFKVQMRNILRLLTVKMHEEVTSKQGQGPHSKSSFKGNYGIVSV